MKKLLCSKEQEEKVCLLYQNGKSAKEIADLFNTTSNTIRNYLIKNNVRRRTNGESHIKYTLNECYFEKINTPDKAYFLGLLVSDGTGNEKGFGLQLQVDDIHIIELFTKYLNYNGKIKIKKDNRKQSYKDCALLFVARQKISKDLAQYGVSKGKSYNAFFPDIPEEFHSHFIRGVFDGDGSIFFPQGRTSGRFDICGNNLLIEKIKEILIEKCFIKNKNICYPDKTKSFVHFTVTSKEEVIRIREYLYKNCEDLYLKRKYARFYSFN